MEGEKEGEIGGKEGEKEGGKEREKEGEKEGGKEEEKMVRSYSTYLYISVESQEMPPLISHRHEITHQIILYHAIKCIMSYHIILHYII